MFQVTVDPALRVLQPQNEEHFVRNCAQKHPSTVSMQTLKKFSADGLYHLGGHSAQEKEFKEFKERANELQTYKDDTCWYVMAFY